MGLVNLTVDQIVVDGDTAYVVAEGETYQPFHREWKVRPPAWMTAKCETCEGNWSWMEPVSTPSGPKEIPTTCDYCIDGKPTHTVEVECPCPADTDGDGDCAACARHPDIHGTIPYRLVVQEVRPIEADSPQPGYPRAVVRDDGLQLLIDLKRVNIRGVAAKPGMYLAICDVIK